MYRLTCELKVGRFLFDSVVEVETASSWDELTDTCIITIPRKLNWLGKNIAWGNDALFRKGDAVTVDLGYDDDNVTVFQGYLNNLTADTPVLLDCQDAAWLLKQTTVTMSWRSVTLTELLRAVVPVELPFHAPDVSLGPFRITNASPAQVLAELRKSYFLKSFVRNGELYVGLAYWPMLQRTHRLAMERNVVQHNLEYRRQEDMKIRLKMISISSNGARLEYETGDAEGEQRTMYYHSLSVADMKAIADAEMARLRYEGYRGDITIYGIPQVNHGDVVVIADASYPEREGRYLVKKVMSTFGSGGYRQILTLAEKV